MSTRTRAFYHSVCVGHAKIFYVSAPGQENLLLASQSPRRQELLQLIGLPFSVKPVEIDESGRTGEPPLAYAQRLAREKALVALAQNPGAIVIAADTVVVDRGEALGKPADAEAAAHMLRRLQRAPHSVLSALVVAGGNGAGPVPEHCSTDVVLRSFTEPELQLYIASGDPMDKAGAYAIQNAEFRPAANLGGCLANVIGLPLCHLTRALRCAGVTVTVDVPRACQAHLQYSCPVHQHILF